ncbi:MAG: PadR family transcriptional regulator [Opitutales bacterium]|nr:PadR family transcriptional regulator [Opitutales bacterium]
MSKDKKDLLQGTLDLLVMRILKAGSRHGYDIVKRIELLSEDTIRVGEGSLYPSLHRLEKRGYVQAHWAQSETGRRAKFYNLTPEGKSMVQEKESYWLEFTSAVNLVLKNA